MPQMNPTSWTILTSIFFFMMIFLMSILNMNFHEKTTTKNKTKMMKEWKW